MHSKARSTFCYLVLLVLSLPIPLLYVYWTNDAIENLRPMIKAPDGHYFPMLMPVKFLLLRWLGQWSLFVPIIVLFLLMGSFWAESLRSASVLFRVALSMCAFATIYGLYSTLVFGIWAGFR